MESGSEAHREARFRGRTGSKASLIVVLVLLGAALVMAMHWMHAEKKGWHLRYLWADRTLHFNGLAHFHLVLHCFSSPHFPSHGHPFAACKGKSRIPEPKMDRSTAWGCMEVAWRHRGLPLVPPTSPNWRTAASRVQRSLEWATAPGQAAWPPGGEMARPH
jgi:hypothetical protein